VLRNRGWRTAARDARPARRRGCPPAPPSLVPPQTVQGRCVLLAVGTRAAPRTPAAAPSGPEDPALSRPATGRPDVGLPDPGEVGRCQQDRCCSSPSRCGPCCLLARATRAAVHPQVADQPGHHRGLRDPVGGRQRLLQRLRPGRYLDLMEAISYRSGCLARTAIWPPLSCPAWALSSWKGAYLHDGGSGRECGIGTPLGGLMGAAVLECLAGGDG
jgi:hypothetical protein